MPHKTSTTLPDDLYAAWKRARIPAIEVWRRGLEGTGDTTRHAATETRLAHIEARIGQMEARVYAPPDPFTDLAEPYDERTREQIDAEYAAQQRARIDKMHAQLWHRIRRIPGQEPAVTVADAMQALRVSDSVARSRMHALAAYGYATQHERKQGTGEPYVWTVHDPDEVDRTMPPYPAATETRE